MEIFRIRSSTSALRIILSIDNLQSSSIDDFSDSVAIFYTDEERICGEFIFIEKQYVEHKLSLRGN